MFHILWHKNSLIFALGKLFLKLEHMGPCKWIDIASFKSTLQDDKLAKINACLMFVCTLVNKYKYCCPWKAMTFYFEILSTLSMNKLAWLQWYHLPTALKQH